MRPVYSEDAWAAQQRWARAQRRAEAVLLFGTGLVAGAALTGLALVLIQAWSG